jgi:hypothetical protein
VTLSLALDESALVPLGDDPLGSDLTAPGTAEQGGADQVFNIAITFNGANFAINGEIFQSPSVPVLLQILSGAQDANSLLPSGSVFNINRGDVVEVTIPGGTAGAPVSVFKVLLVFHGLKLMCRLASIPSSRPRVLCRQECGSDNPQLCQSCTLYLTI